MPMPPRANDYRRVVYYIRKHVAPDARVIESAVLTDCRTGREIMVDVLVEGTMRGRPVAVAIEVRPNGRRAGVEWVDEAHSKYESLPVNQVVLVSRTGFTAEARARASSHGIEAVTPSQNITDSGPLATIKPEAE